MRGFRDTETAYRADHDGPRAAYLPVIANVCAVAFASAIRNPKTKLLPVFDTPADALQSAVTGFFFLFFTATVGGCDRGEGPGGRIVAAVEREIKFAPQTRFSPAISPGYREHSAG